MAKSTGLGVIGFADAFRFLKPDIVVVLGDRFEILACAQAACLIGIPIAHISGGEVTEGAIDDWIRHCITKMSMLHFVAAAPYLKRVIQLGESPDRVFNVGDPGLDGIRKLKLLTRDELSRQLDFQLNSPLFLITYHPATLGRLPPDQAMKELLIALELFPQATMLITKPNADSGGRIMAELAEEFAGRWPERILLSTSLGQTNYLSAMKICNVVVGNSSSGIVEAPALKKPTVNIGPRQSGRLKASSVIDCNETADSIRQAILRAISPDFQRSAQSTVSLYGDNDASARIKRILKSWVKPDILAKHFHDIQV